MSEKIFTPAPTEPESVASARGLLSENISNDELIERLQEAPGGSRELDAHIHLTSFAKPTALGIFYGDEGWPDRTHPSVPPYSTSLDAALPGELITSMTHDPVAGTYHAVNSTPCALGEYRLTSATAHTEPLARRIARLRAMGGE